MSNQRDIQLHVMSWSTIKSREEGGRGGHSELWPLSSQVTIMCDGALLSWKWLNTCLLMGNTGLILYFALLAHAAFALPVKLSLSQLISFLTFTLPILFLIPLGMHKPAAMGC